MGQVEGTRAAPMSPGNSTQPFLGLVIGGQVVPGKATLKVVDPATEQPFAACAQADVEQLNQAVAAAKAAFPGWAALNVEDRRNRILRIAEALEARRDEFGELLMREQGKPLKDARAEVTGAVAVLRAFAGLELKPRTLKDEKGIKVVEHRTPLGVVAAITPWNFPVFILVAKVAPALLAGNTVVAKPAPTTPLTTLLFADLCSEHLPAGVLNAIVDDNDLGGHLTSHPDVAKVSFTGSTATGRRVMKSASDTLKRLTLELGGNDPAILLPDVRPREIAQKIFDGVTFNSGQVCIAIKRLYVHESTYDEMCAELARLADAAVLDAGDHQGAELGPMQNRAQYERLLGLLERARTEGEIIAGGFAPDRPGYFIRPTVIRNISDDAEIVREEQFGPVIPVLRYKDVDDAVRRANDSPYALGASVWSADIAQAAAVAERLAAGTVWINTHNELQLEVPFRGARQSGLGAEFGLEGLHEYTQAHVVHLVTRPHAPCHDAAA